MTTRWRAYQEEVADYFRAVGFDAETDATVAGVRTTHNVDVVVTTEVLGMPLTWLVECKHWARRVPKEKVFALRQIVADVGADRGFLMTEAGYQRGALEAAVNTNVHLRSLADLQETAAHELAMSRLRRIYERARSARTRYWNIEKSTRIAHGLRSEFDEHAYSGDRVSYAIEVSALKAIFNGFPVVYDEVLLQFDRWSGGEIQPGENSLVFDSAAELGAHLHTELAGLESRLAAAEAP